MLRPLSVLLSCMAAGPTMSASVNAVSQKADGYRGIWYFNQPQNDEYRYKYSGGLGTYCANHLPMAVYAPQARKTFFVYGGAKGSIEKSSLIVMVSCYDHKSGRVPKPTIVMDKGTEDAHHNPTLCLDDKGYIWVFVSAHGGKDGFVFRSREPYSIAAFDEMAQREFTYPQPRFIEGSGFLFLFTKYTAGRELYCSTSADGVEWSEPRKYAGFGGHYQVSCRRGDKVGTCFMYHPPVGGLNARTNLYYMETADCGKTWRNAAGEALEVPLSSVRNNALVHDYQAEGLLVYINDLNFDRNGNPVILYVLTRGHESGPKNGPRIWTTARWTGSKWELRPAVTSDHNYDMGSLYIEDDGAWRIIGPTEAGPQRWCTGGEVAMWTSRDQGKTWAKDREMTRNSLRNHTYVRRPVNAHADFYAFWADGDALRASESRLYFANKAGDVWVLPDKMEGEFEKPVRVGGP